MRNHQDIPSTYRCQRVPHDRVEVLNENSYVMGVYSELSGEVKWHRVVPAAQRANIEQWLASHYPVKAASDVKPAKGKSAKAAA
jgi:hypothetical protein